MCCRDWVSSVSSSTDSMSAGSSPSLAKTFHREIGVSLEELTKVLDEVRGPEIGLQLMDGFEEMIQFSVDDEDANPFALLEREEMKEHLQKCMDVLPDRERLLLSLYYYEELTMKEIGEILGVNESRVSQIHSRAVLRLRAHLSERIGATITFTPKARRRSNASARRGSPEL